jgi:hypothetical protein
MTENPPPLRARPWRRPSSDESRSSPYRSYRLVFRLLGIPVLAFAAFLLYRGVHDRFILPACDSDSAKKTLADVLGQLKLEPTRFEPLKTVSSGKDENVCNAVLPLPDGGTVTVDYTFYWQGNTANMKYSVARKRPEKS